MHKLSQLATSTNSMSVIACKHVYSISLKKTLQRQYYQSLIRTNNTENNCDQNLTGFYRITSHNLTILIHVIYEFFFLLFNLIGSIFHTSLELLRCRISQNRQSVVRCWRAGEIIPGALSSIEEIPKTASINNRWLFQHVVVSTRNSFVRND